MNNQYDCSQTGCNKGTKAKNNVVVVQFSYGSLWHLIFDVKIIYSSEDVDHPPPHSWNTERRHAYTEVCLFQLLKSH